MTLRPCITCGEPADGPRCDTHALPSSPKASAHSRGYDAAWTRLSAKARKLQPFCSDCGATEDLQTDHTPEAWQRKAAGRAIRLRDVRVLCGPCNRAAGAARDQQTPSRSQQTRASRVTRGMTPPRSLSDPRGKAKSALHTRFHASAQIPANALTDTANDRAAS